MRALLRSLHRSLFGQLVLSQFLVLAIVAVSVPVGLSRILNGVADDFVAGRLHHDADQLASAVWHDVAGWHLRPGIRMSPLYDRDGGREFALVDAVGNVVATSRSSFRPVALGLPLTAERRFVHRDALDVLVHPLASGNERAWMIVAEDRRHPEVIVDDVVARFLARLAWIIPVTMLVSLAMGAWLARRAMRGIEAVSRDADAIGPDQLQHRLAADRLPLEAQPLANAANLAFDRVEAAYRAQGEFVANVAHELRTPLALIALKAEQIEDREMRAQLHEGIERASHVVSQLMELAFVESVEPGVEAVDASQIALDAVEGQAPLVFRSGRSIEFRDAATPPDPVMGSAGLIGIALTNLIDNAIRHTPVGTRVVVSVLPDGAIRVVDNGPGISSEDSRFARSRYWRADNRRSDSAGLGLAIVDRIMLTLGGSLAIDRAAGGGVEAVLRFKKSAPVRLA